MVFETVKVQVAPLLFHSLGSSEMLWSFEQKRINVDLHIVATPSEKYESNWKSSPNRGEISKIFETTTYRDLIQMDPNFV